LIGPFDDDSRIVDPRGLVVDQKKADTSCGTIGARRRASTCQGSHRQGDGAVELRS
jgi:hypothetical protein